MEMERAVITEQGTTFTAFRVLNGVIQNTALADSVIDTLQKTWGMPVVLVSQELDGKVDYRGQFDIVRFLRGIDPKNLPWERFDFDPFSDIRA